jgi:Transcription factor IIIC subunit delta N-term
MEGSDSALDPIVLRGWPSCTDCLSWSTDGELAVAAGEFVHILTPKNVSKSSFMPASGAVGLRQWHSARVRANVFMQREWPDQSLAPFHSFSVGEEQSLSHVVGLAWSPPGIGQHRRSVLAVLTSNHVLSIWESNGEIGQWSRVVVVNHSLGSYFGQIEEAHEDIRRNKRRIRAFTWSPPYRSFEADSGRTFTSKWGALFLAVANDDETVIILRISKEKRSGQIDWNMEATSQIHLPAVSGDGDVPLPVSLFQKAMARKSPISSLSWSKIEGETSMSFVEVTQLRRRSLIKIQADHLCSKPDSIDRLEHILGLNPFDLEESSQKDDHDDPQSGNVPENAELKKKMEEARIDFDSNHSLDGNSAVRVWGFASAKAQEAACVTIHPSDMVEYTTPSMENCTLLFAPRASLGDGDHLLRRTTSSPANVLQAVTKWTLSAMNVVPLTLPIDRFLLGVSATYAAQLDDEAMVLKAQSAFSRLRETSDLQLDSDQMDVDEAAPSVSLTASDIETCLICESLILFDEHNLVTASCDTGHQYSMYRDETFLPWLLTNASTV